MRYLCTPTSTNDKTGNVPTIWIGASREESIRSCQEVGCPLLHKKYGGQGGDDQTICYAQHGTPAFAHISTCKSHDNGKDKSLAYALRNGSRSARMVRIGAIGDPAALSWLDGAQIRAAVERAGLDLIGYTHGWRLDKARQWRGYLMASCETLAQADAAIADGWRATVVLPFDWTERTFKTPDGHTGIVCPAQIKSSRVTCNTCRLCDGSKRGPVIGFIDHGPNTQGKK